jgi:ethanolamine utilization microcompartment shell protein EutL
MKVFRRTVARVPKLVFLALTLTLCAAAVIVFALLEMRADAIDNAKRDADVLATILAEDVSDVSEALDIALRNIVKTVERATANDFAARASSANMRALLEIQQRDVSRIGLLGITDADGMSCPAVRRLRPPT